MMDTSSQLPFFTQLKKLASKVDRDVAQYETALQKGRNEDFCAPQTLKTIMDMQKELKQMNKNIQEETSKRNAGIANANAILCFANQLQPKLQNYVEKTETYLQQYGYVPKGIQEKDVKKEEEEDKKEDTDEQEKENDKDVGCKTPPRSVQKKADKSRTPRLEDAGISEYTLQLLNNMAKKQNHPAQPKQVKQQTPWPSEFEHNGIICTPSLTGRFENSMMDMHEALASPVLSQNQDTKALDSPVPPKFMTPGMKQILDKVMDEPSEKPTTGHSKRAVHGCLFKADGQDIAGNQSGKGVKTAGYPSSLDDDDLPPEPELTYSLEALSEMTGMFRINPKPAATNGQTLPRPPPQSVQSENKENSTPPEPILLSSKQSRVKDKGDHSLLRHQTLNDELPPSPKLLGNYDFLK